MYNNKYDRFIVEFWNIQKNFIQTETMHVWPCVNIWEAKTLEFEKWPKVCKICNKNIFYHSRHLWPFASLFIFLVQILQGRLVGAYHSRHSWPFASLEVEKKSDANGQLHDRNVREMYQQLPKVTRMVIHFFFKVRK